MSYIDTVQLFTDGGCRGNPGPGAIGIYIANGSNQGLFEHSECIGETTNNRAEYRAVIKGLDLCAKYTRGKVLCFCDSDLVVKQMNGVYRLKDDQLRQLFHEVKKMSQVFKEVVFQHLRRENPNIKKADRILNEAFECRAVSRSLNGS